MSTLLDRTRSSLGPAPRSIAARDNLVPPHWMRGDDPLRSVYPRFPDLLANGDVIWGHVVQANVALFRRGDETAPAQVVYGARAVEALPPERLARAAGAAFALKGRTLVDPGLQRIASALAAETERHDPLDLPAPIAHGAAMRMAIVMIHRPLLPTRLLSSSFVPLLASRERDAVALLPWRHWSEDLVRGWPALGASAR